MDRTDYFYSIPSNAIELWFHTESDRFLNPVLREFYKEAGVVREERRMRIESDPIGRMLDEFLGIAYRAHPYGEPGVGHMSDLENLTRKDAEAFFNKYYTASNITIGIVGDVDTNQMRQFAQAYFGRLPKRDKPDPIRTVEPKQDSERRVVIRAQAMPIALMGYHKPAVTDKDNAVYEAISSLLSSGRSSRLWDSLVTKKRIAVQAGGFTGLPGEKYPGVFVFYGVTAPGKTNAEVEKEMIAEVDRLKTELVSAEELEGVRNRARASLLSLMSSNSSLAGELAQWQALTGDWRNLFRHLDRITKVTAADIQRVAKATFSDSNRSVALLEPQRAPAR
jgi:predicted Zn-dependent peptidase